jgi:hypothetical protein
MLANIRFLVSRGHDVQLHPHTETFDPARPFLNMYTKEEKKRIIAKGIENLVKAGAARPIAHRAGGFSIDQETLELLPEFGIHLDSSVFPLWTASKVPLPDSDLNRLVRMKGVYEFPVTLIQMVPLVGYRGMTPLSLDTTIWEQQECALRQAAVRGLPLVTILAHYHSLYTCTSSGIPYEPFKAICRNEGNYEAFNNILRMLATDKRFRVVTASQLWEIVNRNPETLQGEAFLPYPGLWLTYLKAFKHFRGQHSAVNKVVALAPAILVVVGAVVVLRMVRGRRRKHSKSEERPGSPR